LRVLIRPRRLGPADRTPSDQFDPSLAVDRSDGTLLACYMDTFGDPYRHQAWPTCTLSHDGGRAWAVPVRVALKSSDESQEAADLHGYGSTALVASDGVAHVLWTDTRQILEQSEDIYGARLSESALQVRPRAGAAGPGGAARARSRA
jgi:hypothetical protein